MPFIVQCPFCGARASAPDHAEGRIGRCGKCGSSYTVARAEEAVAAGPPLASLTSAQPMPAAANAAMDDEDTAEYGSKPGLPTWINVWGAVGVALASAALFSAWLVGLRSVCAILAVLGLAAAGASPWVEEKKRQAGLFWCGAGLLANLIVLLLLTASPALLNPYWGMDAAVPRSDPNRLAALELNQPIKPNAPLPESDWVDAAQQAIQQDDFYARVLAAQLGAVEERPEQAAVLIIVRLGNRGAERPIPFAGFTADKYTPILQDDFGKPYTFREQRKRKLPAGGLKFLAAPVEPIELMPNRTLGKSADRGYVDVQLVFDARGEDFARLKLELPAAAWGRKGSCRFRIAAPFEPSGPIVQEK